MKDKLFIFDPVRSGHHKEYIFHLLHYLKEHETDTYEEIHFCVHPAFKASVEDLGFIPHTYFFWKKEKEIQVEKVLSYLKKNELTHFCFMFIDVELTNPENIKLLHNNNIKTQGLYFRPFTRISDTNGTFKQMIKYQGIRLQQGYHLIRSLPKIDKLFVINDLSATKKIHRFSRKANISFLPDPITVLPSDSKSVNSLKEKHLIPSNAKVVLSLGSQLRRKNTLALIPAIDGLLATIDHPVFYFIVGIIYEADYLQEINETAEAFNKKHPNSRIVIVNEFAEKEPYFELADIVSVPYLDFFFSSGIFLHALYYHKPVLTSKFGLIRELTEKYKVGIAVNPHKVDSLTKGLQSLMNNVFPSENFNRFFEENKTSPVDFAKIILGAE